MQIKIMQAVGTTVDTKIIKGQGGHGTQRIKIVKAAVEAVSKGI